MDNLSSHNGPRAPELIEAAGAELMFIPPPDWVSGKLYSPDFDPIENAFAKMKAQLRQAAEPTVDGLRSVIGRIAGTFSLQECENYFDTAGYDPERSAGDLVSAIDEET